MSHGYYIAGDYHTGAWCATLDEARKAVKRYIYSPTRRIESAHRPDWRMGIPASDPATCDECLALKAVRKRDRETPVRP